MDTEKLEQFISVTGAPRDVARGLLEACGGNLDLAINMHLESGGEGANVGAQTGPSPSNFPSSAAGVAGNEAGGMSYEEIHGIRAPIPQMRGVLIDEDPPPRRVMRSRRLPQTVFDPFQDYSSSQKFQGAGDANKKKSLAELFKPPLDIMFLGTFQEARHTGQHKRKWLLVNVQDSTEFASQVLNRDVWSNHNVKEVIRQHFLFWQIHRITDDAVRFRQLYHVKSYPYVAIIDPRTGEKMVDWNTLTEQGFLSGVYEFLANNSFEDDVDGSGMLGQSDNIADQSEESQLEAAIRASLQEGEGKMSSRGKEQTTINLTDDSDDFVSISSGGSDTGGNFSDCEEIGNSTVRNLQDVTNITSLTSCAKPLAKNERNSDGVLKSTRLQMREGVERLSLHPQGENVVERISPSARNSSSGTPKLSPTVQLTSFSVDVNDILSPSNSTRKRPYSEEMDEVEVIDGPRLRKSVRVDDHSDLKVSQTNVHPSDNGSNEVVDSSKGCRMEPSLRKEPCQKAKRTERRGKGRVGAVVKQKGMSSVHVTDGAGSLSVEEQLASGSISKDEVSWIVVRLLDGSRVQKSFICNHPIEELFHFLKLQDIDLTENEVLTQFPRRSISALQQSTSFKEAGLYPREMVFIHPCD